MSTRTRALLAAGLAVLLIVLIVVVVRANTSSDNSTVQGNGTVQGPAAAPAAGAGLELDSTPVTTPDGVRLTDLAAASRNNPPRVGDTVTVTYSLTNIGTRPVQLDFTFVGVRNGGTNKDTEDGKDEKRGGNAAGGSFKWHGGAGRGTPRGLVSGGRCRAAPR